jgi:hypothetical protein
MKLIERIDSAFLKLFTKFSHWFQRLTGKTNFFLARICLVIVVLGSMIFVFNFWIPLLSHPTRPYDVFLSGLFIPMMVYVEAHLKKAEDDFGGNVAIKPIIQSAFIGSIFQVLRTLMMLLLILSTPWDIYSFFDGHLKGVWLFNLLHEMSYRCFASFYYFIAVDPLPPGKSRVRQWIELFRFGFSKPRVAEAPNR